MKALIIEPMKPPYTKEINSNLDALQEVVEGTIQIIYPFEDRVCIICNDDEKIIGLPPNRALRYDSGEIYDILVGTFMITGVGEEDLCSLTEEQIEKYKKLFQHPEQFLKFGDSIIALQL